MKRIQFKILQRRTRFRNPSHLTQLPDNFTFSQKEWAAAETYIDKLNVQNIQSTYPGHENYPTAFLKMKEPPLFLEYKGKPFWKNMRFISVVGSRDLSFLTEGWMKSELSSFIQNSSAGIVSGGARGVDQLAHLLCLKLSRPSIFILPSGLDCIYPPNLSHFQNAEYEKLACFLSEFELDQKIHKAHFYFRNRLISALSQFTLVTQASLKSGSLLTVHHCLENGRPVLTVPSHPHMIGFDGNLKLIREGAFPAASQQDLLDFWNAEIAYK